MIYIIALSVIAGALGFYYFFYKNVNQFKKHGILYKQPIPLLGNMGPLIMCRQSMVELMNDTYNLCPEAKYVGMFGFMNQPGLMLRDPELIKSITLKHSDIFPDHAILVDTRQDILLGKNLFSLRGEEWRQERSILTAAFTSSKLKSMFKLISVCSVDFSNYLVQLPPEQKIVQMKDVFSRYTNDVIATCAFGISVDSLKNPENEFYAYSKEATTLNIRRTLKLFTIGMFPRFARLFNLKYTRQEVGDFFVNVVKTTVQAREENGIVRPDLLQIMMESRGKDGKPELSIEDMVGHAFIFFLAGFEAASTLMCFATHEIGVNQDIQRKLQNEIDQVLEDTNGQPSYEAIINMEYLDAVISETLRMYPGGVVLDRVCVQDFELPPALPKLKPFTLKKGQGIAVSFYGIMHDPNYFKEPNKFDPDRFCGEQRKATLSSGAYFPFGLGPRTCIGNRFTLMEIKNVLFHLLARCDLEICEKTPIPLKFVNGGFIMKIEGDFWLKVLPRKDLHHTLVTNLANETS